MEPGTWKTWNYSQLYEDIQVHYSLQSITSKIILVLISLSLMTHYFISGNYSQKLNLGDFESLFYLLKKLTNITQESYET